MTLAGPGQDQARSSHGSPTSGTTPKQVHLPGLAAPLKALACQASLHRHDTGHSKKHSPPAPLVEKSLSQAKFRGRAQAGFPDSLLLSRPSLRGPGACHRKFSNREERPSASLWTAEQRLVLRRCPDIPGRPGSQQEQTNAPAGLLQHVSSGVKKRFPVQEDQQDWGQQLRLRRACTQRNCTALEGAALLEVPRNHSSKEGQKPHGSWSEQLTRVKVA